MGGGVDQPAAALRSRPAGCRPTGRRAGAPAARRVRPAARGASAPAARGRRWPPSDEGAASRARRASGRQALRGVELRPASSTARWGGPRLPVVRRSSRPKHAGAAWWRRARPRPRLGLGALVPACRRRSTPARGTGVRPPSPSDTASTSGTRTASGSRSHRQPRRLGGEEPRRRVRVGLGEHTPSVVQLEPVGLGDVTAPHHRRPRRRSLRARPRSRLAALPPASRVRAETQNRTGPRRRRRAERERASRQPTTLIATGRTTDRTGVRSSSHVCGPEVDQIVRLS